MKIAVYTIALNEEAFVQRWYESAKEADHILILDTGSTDDTTHLAHSLGIHTITREFNPWRFDTARNTALSMLPKDMDLCIALDMDEVLQPGWREALEIFLKENPTVNRPRYKYIWSWNPDGSEGLVYAGDKIHSNTDYIWKHPVHETLKPLNEEQQGFVPGLEIHHHPDNTKSRSQYLPLLKLAVEENPQDDRNQFYLARELFFAGDYDLAQYHFARHLDLSTWNPERAATHRYLAKMVPTATEFHLYRAIAEDPNRRESWVDLALHYHNQHNWLACRNAASSTLAITEKPLDYLCEAEAWSWLPHDLMAVASYHLGDTDEAFHHGAIAVALNPNDERLKTNLTHYRL
jgi:glycosyltransferase involved in cell wall biosynthesis